MRSILDRAAGLLRARRFAQAIKLLEGARDGGGAQEYKESFDFFYTLGVACMYQGDIGGADLYLNKAGKIKLRDPRLMAAQGALFLRRGNTARAVDYFLDVLEQNPKNRIAGQALTFIKALPRGMENETIVRWIETGKIKRFYPPLGLHPLVKWLTLSGIVAGVLGAALSFVLPLGREAAQPRADLRALTLTAEEEKSPLETDPSSSVYRYILSPKEITAAYAQAIRRFQEYRDNAAQKEINRILNSNAAAGIRQKARILMDYLGEPTFDSLADNYDYAAVALDPYLYQDCFVDWSGRISNLRNTETGLQCDLLVGYENQRTLEGIVPLVFDFSPDLDTTRPVRVLGRLTVQDKKLLLAVKGVYQPLPGKP